MNTYSEQQPKPKIFGDRFISSRTNDLFNGFDTKAEIFSEDVLNPENDKIQTAEDSQTETSNSGR